MTGIYKLFRAFHFHFFLVVSNNHYNILAHLQEQKIGAYGKLGVISRLSVHCDQAVAVHIDKSKCFRSPRNFLWEATHLSTEPQAFNTVTSQFLTFILPKYLMQLHAYSNSCPKIQMLNSKRN